MQEAAADERFEEAARYRNRLRSVQHLAERQAADRRSVGTIDVDRARGRRRPGRRAGLPASRRQDDRPLLLPPRERRRAGPRRRCSSRSASSTTARLRACRRRSSCPRDVGDTSALADFLSERRGARVEVRAAERGEKRRLQELATENARHALASEVHQSELKRLRRVEALEELREVLNLEALPTPDRVLRHLDGDGAGQRRLDGRLPGRCGQEGALPEVRDQGSGGMDDFAAMAEVVSRRFARLVGRRPREEYDESFAATPNLVVIDGGKGQLSAALAAMQAFDLPRVAVVALAKRVEEVFVPGPAGSDPARRALAGPAASAADPGRGAPLRRRLPPPAA